MKLITVITQQDDVAALIEALRRADVRSTRLDAAGGFLRRGNPTLLIGVEDDQVDDVLKLVQTTCSARDVPAPNKPSSNVRNAAATVFVLNIGRFERL